MPNRLSTEASPYLRQHALNPVEWYPWGEEAFAVARANDRPILLSIGYSSCHWCHVMERESFENPDVAALMNELFVSVKVDREERPDLDQIYMKAVQAMTGGGGWPMTVFLTPDAIPYYGGTYFPPTPRHGLPSFPQVLRGAANAYADRREDVARSGANLVDALAKLATSDGTAHLTPDVLDAAARSLARQYDSVHGGFGGAPKFPQPVALEFLIRHHLRTGDTAAIDQVVHTLRRMAAGGLRDHLGGGFHRYAVDDRWLVPHFEKMLYDNGLLARTYLRAHLLTGQPDLRLITEDTLDYMGSDLRLPHGGFAAARDADSGGEEGRFYVWQAHELDAIPDPADRALFARAYDVTPEGNFEGTNILHLPHSFEWLAKAEGLTTPEVESRLGAARALLLAERARRESPFRDEKVIVSWNSFAIRAFAEAGAALGRPDYTDVARHAAEFVWREMRRDGRLLHLHIAEEGRGLGYLDDHAGLGTSLLALHAATLDVKWLDASRWLCEEILARFWDDDKGVVFDTAADAERLIFRPRDPMDNATPSGSSLAAELLARAGHVFDEGRYREVSRRIIEREAEMLSKFGPALGHMLSAYDLSLAPPVEIAILSGHDPQSCRELIRAAHARPLSNLTVVGRLAEQVVTGVPLLEGREARGDQSVAYVCKGYSCGLPSETPAEVRRQLAEVDGT